MGASSRNNCPRLSLVRPLHPPCCPLTPVVRKFFKGGSAFCRAKVAVYINIVKLFAMLIDCNFAM